MFERFSSGFAVELTSKLERSKIVCEAIFCDASVQREPPSR